MKPECMIAPENLIGRDKVDEGSVIHAAIEKYLKSRVEHVDDNITNKLVLNLPFQAEAKCSEDLLHHTNGMVCPLANPPKNVHKGLSSRSLVLTFKEKESNYTSKKKASVNMGILSKSAFASPGGESVEARMHSVGGTNKRQRG